MRKTVLFWPFLMMTTLSAFSQDWKKARVLRNSPDTLNVEVKDKGWLYGPTTIQLRNPQSGSVEEVSAGDIKWVSIENGDTYVAASVLLDATPRDIEIERGDTSVMRMKEARVFLLELVKHPKLSLYVSEATGFPQFILQKDQGEYQTLVSRRFRMNTAGEVRELEDKQYYDQLRGIMSDCPGVSGSINRTSYDSRSMVSLVEKYLKECGGTVDQTSIRKKEKGKFEFSIIAGAGFTSYKFEKEEFFVDNPLVTEASMGGSSLTFGGRIAFVAPRMHQKVAFLLDVLYYKVKGDNTTKFDVIADDYYKERILKIDLNYLKNHLMARYSFGKETTLLRPFLGIGVGVNLVIGDNSSLTRNAYYQGEKTTNTTDAFPPNTLNKTQLSFLGSTGFTLNRLLVEYRFEPSTNILNGYKTNFITHNFLVGFRLK
ncbi:PorT family protein [Flavihumibacter rivuli]|uniref:PorT family protein n=1 Tax=Flavihumibacter rivuli TaxID=2838156 RepID=UPI001BDE1CD8|nr:PorT family protein [Flavihumibacter rivuli]ULQ58138.1 PorT family protein [Flavihumibacter rivuli]